MHQTEKLLDRTSGETIRVGQTKHVHITLCGRTNRQWYYDMHQTEKLFDRTSGGCQIAISYCVNLAYNIEKEDQSHHHLYHQWSKNRLPFRSTYIHSRFLLGFVLLDLQFLCVLQIVVCPFVPFILAIVLSVLLFTNSDSPSGIFKLFSHLIEAKLTMNEYVVIGNPRSWQPQYVDAVDLCGKKSSRKLKMIELKIFINDHQLI